LFHDASKAEIAANALKLTATDLKKNGIIDHVIAEPDGGAHVNPDATAANLKAALVAALDEFAAEPIDKLLEQRFEKFRRIGAWQEKKSASSRQTKKKKS
jgi:acetyl-CoA carboxylase carboxyl transferase subunit alpha